MYITSGYFCCCPDIETLKYQKSQAYNFCEQVMRPRAIRGIFTGWNKTFHFRFKERGRTGQNVSFNLFSKYESCQVYIEI